MKACNKKFALALSIGLACVAYQSSAWADRLDEIKNRGTLICGTVGTVPPFRYQDPKTRKTTGYDVEVCDLVAEYLGVKNEVKLVAVPARIPEVLHGRIDVAAAAQGWTPERAKQVAYSYAYYSTSSGLAAPASKGISSWDVIPGRP